MTRLLPVDADEPESEDSWPGIADRRGAFEPKRLALLAAVVAFVAVAVALRRRRSGGPESPSGEELEGEVEPGDGLSTEEIQERSESDVQEESPEPGEMIVDEDVVEDVIDEDVDDADAEPGESEE